MDVSLQYTYRVTNPERFALAVDDPERHRVRVCAGPAARCNQHQGDDRRDEPARRDEPGDHAGVEGEGGPVRGRVHDGADSKRVASGGGAFRDQGPGWWRRSCRSRPRPRRRSSASRPTPNSTPRRSRPMPTRTGSRRRQRRRPNRSGLRPRRSSWRMRAILGELEGKGALAERYIDYLIAGELKENSKWILGHGGGAGARAASGRGESDRCDGSLLLVGAVLLLAWLQGDCAARAGRYAISQRADRETHLRLP